MLSTSEYLQKFFRKVIKNQIHMLELSKALKQIVIDTVYFSEQKHFIIPLEFADIITVLSFEFLNTDDKIIISNEHGVLLLYSFYYLINHPWYTIDSLKKFGKFGSNTPIHPEYNYSIPATTGLFGQGFGTAVGMAIAAKKNNLNYKIFCIVGQNCLMTGISYEAISLASKLKLNNLIILFNNSQSKNSIKQNESEKQKFLNMNWNAIKINGHDLKDIRKGFNFALKSTHKSQDPKPIFIEFETISDKYIKSTNIKKIEINKLSIEDLISIKNNFDLEIQEKNQSLGKTKVNSNTASNINTINPHFLKTCSSNISNIKSITANKEANNAIVLSTISELEKNTAQNELFSIDQKILNQWHAYNFLIERHILRDYIIYCKTNKIDLDKVKNYQDKYQINLKNDENCNLKDFGPKSYHYYGIKTKDLIESDHGLIHNSHDNYANFYKTFEKKLTEDRLINKFSPTYPKLSFKMHNADTEKILKEIFNSIYIQYHNYPVSEQIFMKILDKLFEFKVSNLIFNVSNEYYGNIAFANNTIHYGPREQLMGTACNGLALSGYIPICKTQLIFSDYLKSSIRMAAIMKLKIIYIMTHDSIGSENQGSIYQPIEQLVTFRALPNLMLFRPYLVQDLLLSIRYALDYNGPSMICLPNQNLEFLEKEINQMLTQNLYFHHLAGYIIAGLIQNNICIISTGSDVEIALKVRKILIEIDSKIFHVKVISIPSVSMLDKYLKVYTNRIFNNNLLKNILNHDKDEIKSNVNFANTHSNTNDKTSYPKDSFNKIIKADYLFIIESSATLTLGNIINFGEYKIFKQYSLDEFGHSGSKEDLYKYFGLTPKIIAKDIIQTMMKNF